MENIDNYIEVFDDYDAFVNYPDEGNLYQVNETTDLVNETTDLVNETTALVTETTDLVNETTDLVSESTDFNQWSDAATKLLIVLRGSRNEQFEKIKKKGKKLEQWFLISKEMKAKQFAYTPKQCDEKWRRLMTRFRQVRDASKLSGSGGIKWKYFRFIEHIISPKSKQAISPPKNLLQESSSTIQTPCSISTSECQTPSTTQDSVLSSSTVKPKSLFNKTSHDKSPSWLRKFEELKREQMEAINNNANELNNRLDKLDKREESMLKTQEELVRKLDDANKIELQKIDVFKKMFNID